MSLEVAPALAHDTEGTVTAARHFHELVAEPNLYVKIPATAEGVPADPDDDRRGQAASTSRSLFSLERYGEVIEAYIGGLEDRVAAGGDRPVARRSVASFFVSRVDTEVDRRLDALAAGARATTPPPAGPAGPRRRGPGAGRAYQLFTERFAGPRWEALAAKGATVQRPLWASTSTKNPAYPDLAYVDTLIGPDTVNTMPDDDHRRLPRPWHRGPHRRRRPDEARVRWPTLAEVGVDMADVARTLEDEGVASFAKSFDELMQSLSDKATHPGRGR